MYHTGQIDNGCLEQNYFEILFRNKLEVSIFDCRNISENHLVVRVSPSVVVPECAYVPVPVII